MKYWLLLIFSIGTLIVLTLSNKESNPSINNQPEISSELKVVDSKLIISKPTISEPIKTNNSSNNEPIPPQKEESNEGSLASNLDKNTNDIESNLIQGSDLNATYLNTLMMGESFFDSIAYLQPSSPDISPNNWSRDELISFLESSELYKNGEFYINQFNCGSKVCLGSISYSNIESKNDLHDLLNEKSKFLYIVNYSEEEREVRVAISYLPLSVSI